MANQVRMTVARRTPATLFATGCLPSTAIQASNDRLSAGADPSRRWGWPWNTDAGQAWTERKPNMNQRTQCTSRGSPGAQNVRRGILGPPTALSSGVRYVYGRPAGRSGPRVSPYG